MSELHRYNLTHDDVLRQINASLEANSGYYRGSHTRCVAIKENGTWNSALCLIRVLPTEMPLVPVGSLRYKEVHLLQSYLDLSHLRTLTLELPTGILAIDGEPIHVGAGTGFFAVDQLPSNNDYSDLPGYLCQSSNRSVTSALPQEPLVDFDLPYYRDVYDAIRDWIGLRRFYSFSDARIGHVWLFLPECRARFKEVKISGGYLEIQVARGANHATHPLRVTGSWNSSTGPRPISLSVSNTMVSTKVVSGATGVDLFLVDQGGTLDYHQETPFLSVGQSRILPSEQGNEEDEPHAVDVMPRLHEMGEERAKSRQPIDLRAPAALHGLKLHPRILQVVANLFADGHYANAVLDGAIALTSYVKERSGRHDLDGAQLMRTVFSANNPVLVFNEFEDQTDRDEQEGMMHLFEGAVLGIRNPRAHELFEHDPQRALEYIVLLSLLTKRADEARRAR